MKIKIIALVIACCFVSSAHAQMPDSIKMVLDSSIHLLQQHALNSKKTNWPLVKQTAYHKAANATTWNGLGDAAAYLFEAVNDHHGWLSLGDTNFKWNPKSSLRFSEAVKNEMSKGNRIIKKLLTKDIGYLRVPGMMLDTSQYNKMAQKLADSLLSLEQTGATKIIIDLRLNAGGTMFPMIAGLSALLGNGEFIGNADAAGNITSMDILHNGKFTSSDGGIAAVSNKNVHFSPSSKVVILISNLTGSAGECVAVSFKGRRNTKFIGEPTAGYTIGNDGHWIIPDKAAIVIAESAIVDRNKKIYYVDMQPDKLIWGGDNFDDYLKDKKIQAAIKWLNEK